MSLSLADAGVHVATVAQDFGDFAEKVGGEEGFANEGELAAGPNFLQGIGVTRHKEDLDGGIDLADLLRHLQAAAFRHDDVGQHEADLPAMLLVSPKALVTVRRYHGAVSARREDSGSHAHDDVL